jgi:hypothetical protein
MCAPSAPAAPDYKGAAEATGLSQKVSQYTPYGSLEYGADPTSPSGFKSTTTLDPKAQQALDTQMGLSAGVGDIAQQQLPQVEQQYSKPMDLSSVPQISDQAYEAQTARLDPQWDQRAEQNRTMLANQGLSPGGEAYTNAMRDFEAARTDAYGQARLGAIQTMPQTYQLASSAYNQPLNTLNALRPGAQVQNPQFGQGGVPTNYGQAAQQQGQWQQGLFNADMGAYNAQLGGAAALGGSYLYGLAAGSDRRLKRNIERIGTHPLGIGIYEYDIFDRHEIGVMADEVERVMPQAVITGADGYKRVYYAML